MQSLTLFHFFPDRLNLYSDRGNVMILKKRCEWRGINLNVVPINRADDSPISEADILLIGGGSDREQSLCTQELVKIRPDLQAAIDDGIAATAICGGYQFLGAYYELPNGEKIKGLGILDFYTKSTDLEKRMIGDLFVHSPTFGNIMGYENHSGETFHDYQPLGTVVAGYGNNRDRTSEGLVYQHLIGTYLHGPLFSKNPQIADWLISHALDRKYGDGSMEPLNDKYVEKAKEHLWTRRKKLTHRFFKPVHSL